MNNFNKLPAGFKLSLLALAIVAVAGCSSSGTVNSPESSGGGTEQPNSGGSGGDGGGDTGGGGDTSDPSDPDPTYGTVNPADEIPAGEVFALDTTTIQPTETNEGVTINSGPTVGANATITVLEQAADGSSRLQLRDPDNGVDVILTEGDFTGFYEGANGAEIELFSQDSSLASRIPSGGLSYAAYGFWSVPQSANSNELDVGFFAGGYATRTDDMPDMGTATFTGVANGFSVTAAGVPSDVIGNVRMDVDFGADTLTGAMTNMRSGADIDGALNSTTPWNDVAFSGSIIGNAFSADADVTNAPDNAAALDANAEGNVTGRFYGPQAAEAAGTWSLEDTSGGTAFGAFGVKQ
ncbi:transferrin-binding protein-like solute binding protein [Halomonas urumqiensis]|uniref:Transferrin-binding protein B C-lobe/N-lobe beta-barrel domain-containing protein n=1 Tax=Halomonas urumqiensis TaxID=1684789 RepID=A0A2N7UKE7_9GAMM|nr:transferrin-binding protein-like solute binding protein [Halomonas urumqiensis]PMR80918.1 hypothetical protein C1H70_07650 [Halomonas urumqiensis]PTB02876.1 hypothetical protein C6V82_09650 [Halomonas urumqiensis]